MCEIGGKRHLMQILKDVDECSFVTVFSNVKSHSTVVRSRFFHGHKLCQLCLNTIISYSLESILILSFYHVDLLYVELIAVVDDH